MPDYYYTQEPASAHKERSITARALGLTLSFETDAGVFSKNELDPGSRLLIESMGALSGRVWAAAGGLWARSYRWPIRRRSWSCRTSTSARSIWRVAT